MRESAALLGRRRSIRRPLAARRRSSGLAVPDAANPDSGSGLRRVLAHLASHPDASSDDLLRASDGRLRVGRQSERSDVSSADDRNGRGDQHESGAHAGAHADAAAHGGDDPGGRRDGVWPWRSGGGGLHDADLESAIPDPVADVPHDAGIRLYLDGKSDGNPRRDKWGAERDLT